MSRFRVKEAFYKNRHAVLAFNSLLRMHGLKAATQIFDSPRVMFFLQITISCQSSAQLRISLGQCVSSRSTGESRRSSDCGGLPSKDSENAQFLKWNLQTRALSWRRCSDFRLGLEPRHVFLERRLKVFAKNGERTKTAHCGSSL